MPYYIEGIFYYTQPELQLTLNRLLETCWMYSHCQSEEQRKYLTDSIIFNFKMDHPEFGIRTEADDEAMKVRYEGLKAEENAQRLAEKARIAVAEREAHMTRLREIVSQGYHPLFYEKLIRYIDRCKTASYGEYTKIQENILYCNPNSFLDFLPEPDFIPKLTSGDVITICDGGLKPIYVLLRYTPILSLYNMERNLENTKDEYIYGIVIDAPEGVPFPKNTRMIVQTKNIRKIEGKISDSVQTEEMTEFEIS